MDANPTPEAPQIALEGAEAGEAIPPPAEVKSRLDALMASPAGKLIGRELGLGDPDDPHELLGPSDGYRAALARVVWWG